MIRWLVRLLLAAVVFSFVLPIVPGIAIHGGFGVAIVLALLFGVILWVVDLIAIGITALLTISTLGLALLWLIPIWIIGFWFLPVLALKLLSDFMPNYLTVAGWVPAILGGLVLLVVGLVTGSSWKKIRSG